MNRKITLVLSIYCMGLMSVFAQSIIPVNSTVKHKKKEKPCISVVLETYPKELKKEWRDYMKDKYSVKLKGIGFLSNKDVLSAEGVQIPEISEKTIDFYTYIDEENGGSVMKVFACLGYDYCINEQEMPQEYKALKGILEKFLKEYLPDYYRQYIKEGEKEVKDLEKECKKTDKNIEGINKRIEKLKDEIKKSQEFLKERKDMLENARVRLKNREEKYKMIQKQLKDL